MRRFFGCLSMLLLLAAVFLALLARGPGLQGLPAFNGLEAITSVLAPSPDTSTAPATRLPTLAPTTPATLPQPPTPIPPRPTDTAVPPLPVPKPGQLSLTVRVHGPSGEALGAVIDGNTIALTAEVTNPTAESVRSDITFALSYSGAGDQPFARCPVEVSPGGLASCTVRTAADGWAWRDHQPVGRRTVFATLVGHSVAATADVLVRPKPVVLVHGFTGTAATWRLWTGPDGFLAPWGIAGYAVGDGQFGIEAMDTGEVTQPRRPTRSIAENAHIIARYVDAVRAANGAERIDLVAHSMGGLISRFYVSHYMPLVERPGLPAVPAVNQLYMIGTPNGGTPCAIPPATLGLYAPATTELTPSYVQHVFNPQTSDPRGVPFLVMAGDPVRDFAALVCTPIPTDAFVSVGSAAGAIPVTAQTMPVRHGEQTGSTAVFAAVLQSLTRGTADYPIAMPTAPATAPADDAALQISLVSSGTLPADGPAALSLPVDEVEGASFQLYAPGQDLEMTILSSVGQSITRETAKDAPGVSTETADGRETTATQGFKIQKPQAGQWQLILKPRSGVQAEGAFYAVAAFLQSDLRLTVETPSPLAAAGQPVTLRAVLAGPAAPGTGVASATVRDARGDVVGEVALYDDGAHDDGGAGDGVFAGIWPAAGPGLYSVTVTASGQTTAGSAFGRVGLLAVEVR